MAALRVPLTGSSSISPPFSAGMSHNLNQRNLHKTIQKPSKAVAAMTAVTA